jgi:hypothetical protein
LKKASSRTVFKHVSKSHLRKSKIAIGCITFTFTALLFSPSVFASSTTTTSVSVSVPVGNSVSVTSPGSSNLTIRSITGNGHYSLETMQEGNTTILTFIPTNATQFLLVINVSSSSGSPNYANVAVQNSTSASVVPNQNTSIRNVTGSGNLIIDLKINALSASSSGSDSSISWNPLFGMLPVKLQPPSLSLAQVIEVIAGIGAFFLALGIAFKSKVSYLGVLILIIVGIATVGILVLLSVLGAYLLSFGLVNLAWKLKLMKHKK